MFVRSFKASSVKFFGLIFLCCAAVCALILILPDYEPSYPIDREVNYKGVKTESDRIEFLSQFGWEVEETALDEAKITLPESFDAVYEKFNELQVSQGLDLTRYGGKTVMRYTYKVLNYPGYDEAVLADVIVYKNRVIAGCICSANAEGFIHGFELPDGAGEK